MKLLGHRFGNKANEHIVERLRRQAQISGAGKMTLASPSQTLFAFIYLPALQADPSKSCPRQGPERALKSLAEGAGSACSGLWAHCVKAMSR